VEKEYFSRTGIFPVMHAVVIKRSVLDSHPWVAGSLMKAFEQSLRVAKEELVYRSSEAFLRYSDRQGLAQKQWKPEEIFAASAASSYVV
jgi:4,5-dihydroxyphthalate decarboxylase